MKRFAIGDIHGRYEALLQVLEASKFDYDNDKLIILGDVCDGGRDTKKVVDELLKIKNIIFIRGNHDQWFMQNISSGFEEEIWLQQGGANTLESYGGKIIKLASNGSELSIINTKNVKIPVTHQDFFNKSVLYHIEDNMIFVHGGFSPLIHIDKNTERDLMWDRKLAFGSSCPIYKNDVSPIDKKVCWDKVFIGHTTTQLINDTTNPVIKDNLYCIDCGAGWNGRLCIYDIDSDEYWLSDTQKPCL